MEETRYLVRRRLYLGDPVVVYANLNTGEGGAVRVAWTDRRDMGDLMAAEDAVWLVARLRDLVGSASVSYDVVPA